MPSSSADPNPYESLTETERYQLAARKLARKYELDPDLFEAQIAQESSWNPAAVSPKGAAGLGQLMPEMQQALGVADPMDPLQSLDGAARFMRDLTQKYGDQQTALTAYHAGETNFDKGRIGPKSAAYGGQVQAHVVPAAAPAPREALPPMSAANEPVQQPSQDLLLAPYQRMQRDLTEGLAGISTDPRVLDQSAASDVIAAGLMPGGSTFLRAAGSSGLFGALTATRDAVKARLSPDAGLADLPEAVASLDGQDLAAIGMAAGAGTLLGGASYGVARALTGGPAEIPAPPEVPPRPVLRPLPEPPEALPVPKPPLPMSPPPVPQPMAPTGEQVATLTAREAQREAQAAAATRLGASEAVSARALVPQPNKPEVDAAYAALFQTRGETPVNVTGVRARLRSAGINPGELGLGGEQYEAPLKETLDALSRVNAARFRTITQAEGGGFRGGELRILSKELYDDIANQLQPHEQALLGKAMDVALSNGQIKRLQMLIDTTQREGVPQGAAGLNRLLNKPQYWRTKLGDDLYDYGVDWFRNLSTLQQTPVGERVVATVAKETAAYREALAMHGARVADVGRRNTEAAQAYADKLIALERRMSDRLVRHQGRVAMTEARNTHVLRQYDEGVARAQAAYQERVAAIQPPGASQTVRGLIEAPIGAAVGAATAYGMGLSPRWGAMGGMFGFGLAHQLHDPLISPAFAAGFRFLANHPQGTQAWFQGAGRLTLQAMIENDVLTPKPQPKPTPRYPIEPGGPRALGRVAAR